MGEGVIWKSIPNMRGYEAGSNGKIRSIDRKVSRIMPDGKVVEQPLRGRVLSPSKCKNGYLYVSIMGRSYQAHRLVCMAWHGPPVGSIDAAHFNNNRHDNRPENLRWASRSENLSDQVSHGTRLRGETQNGAKLTEHLVLRLRQEREKGTSWSKLASMFSMSIAGVRAAAIGRTWSHISA